MSKVVLRDNSKKWANLNSKALDLAMQRVSVDVEQLTKVTIPFKSGELHKSVLAERKGFLKHRVSVDKEYAAYQERGQRRDGTHVVRKYSTPGTGPHSLENAGAKVGGNSLNYIKQAVNLVRL